MSGRACIGRGGVVGGGVDAAVLAAAELALELAAELADDDAAELAAVDAAAAAALLAVCAAAFATVCCTTGLFITGHVSDSYVAFVVNNQLCKTPVCTSIGVNVLI